MFNIDDDLCKESPLGAAIKKAALNKKIATIIELKKNYLELEETNADGKVSVYKVTNAEKVCRYLPILNCVEEVYFKIDEQRNVYDVVPVSFSKIRDFEGVIPEPTGTLLALDMANTSEHERYALERKNERMLVWMDQIDSEVTNGYIKEMQEKFESHYAKMCLIFGGILLVILMRCLNIGS